MAAEQLTDLQLEFMRVLWEAGEGTVADVQDRLQAGGRALAPTTVSTVLRRLESQGWVSHRERGRQFIYRAAVSRDDATGDMLDRLRDAAVRRGRAGDGQPVAGRREAAQERSGCHPGADRSEGAGAPAEREDEMIRLALLPQSMFVLSVLLTYLVHSTLWFLVAWAASHPGLGLSSAARSRVWRAALVGPLLRHGAGAGGGRRLAVAGGGADPGRPRPPWTPAVAVPALPALIDLDPEAPLPRCG